MRVFKAPQKIDFYEQNVRLFLAGSIDMGSAIDWQTHVTNELDGYDVDIYNPRRDDWDSTWEQSKDNAKFREQVEWELNAQHNSADIICFYFDPAGQAPITLLELGISKDQDIVVCCPKGFWRKGNVDIVCEYFGIPMVESLDDMVEWIRDRLI